MAKSKFSLPERPAVDNSKLEAFAAAADAASPEQAPPAEVPQASTAISPRSGALRVAAVDSNLKRARGESSLERALADVLPEARGDFDPEAKPTYALNVRLNAYELALLRLLARASDRSQHWIVKNTLVPRLEEAASKLLGEEH